jgi:hypothetical protein
VRSGIWTPLPTQVPPSLTSAVDACGVHAKALAQQCQAAPQPPMVELALGLALALALAVVLAVAGSGE